MVLDHAYIRQVKSFITLNTSTSFIECNSIPLCDLIDFYNDVYEYKKAVNEAYSQ